MMETSSDYIVFIDGPQLQFSVPLKKTSLTIGRGDEDSGWKPDVDLNPDSKVSSQHAHLFFKKERWWLEDGNSENGTLMEGREIKGAGPKVISPLKPVTMGGSRWMIAPPGYILEREGDLVIGYRMVKALNYALYHCGIPVLTDLVIRNLGSEASPPLSLTIEIKGYSRPWQKDFDPLPSGGKIFLNKAMPDVDYETLEGIDGSSKTRLNLELNHTLVSSEEISILGFFEWSLDPAFRRSLAGFVMPSHPVVQNIVLDSIDFLDHSVPVPSFTHLLRSDLPEKTEYALRAIYDCLKDKSSIHYVFEPQSFEKGYQKIRPPHDIFTDSLNRRGVGTCIDLGLLFASCIENICLQPLLIFVKGEGTSQHAFLGCWKDVAPRFRPVVSDFRGIEKDRIFLLETTGVTDRWSNRLSYDESVKFAHDQLDEDHFLFVLDIAALRQTVVPLQYPMSPGATHVLRQAEALARKQGSTKLETKHLFFNLLVDGDETIERAVVRAGGNRSCLSVVVMFHPGKSGPRPHPTMNYNRAIQDAKLIAGDAMGIKKTDKPHLFYALLLSQSESVDAILEQIGTDRRRVKGCFEEICPWTRKIEQTYFESSPIFPKDSE